MKKGEDYLDYILKDDETPYGGTSFNGETLRDFLDSVEIEYATSMEEINKALVECGIKPITI